MGQLIWTHSSLILWNWPQDNAQVGGGRIDLEKQEAQQVRQQQGLQHVSRYSSKVQMIIEIPFETNKKVVKSISHGQI